MKYIRTKDGIYEVDKEHSDNKWIEVKLGNGWNHHFLSSEIKDQADTIEELCDELVFEWHRSSISHDNDIWHLYHEMSLKEEVENALNDGFRASKEEVKNIYGAIWIKGKHNEPILKPVARLNKKGELELL